jgi:hypothetical protein
MSKRQVRAIYPDTAAGDEWYAWKARLWDAMTARLGYPGLAHLEQVMHRSSHESRCVECGESGTVAQISGLILSVKSYWFCDECDADWAAKATA